MTATTYRCGDFEIDPDNRALSRGGIVIPVEPKVFAVLVQLLLHANELITRNALLDAVWGHRYVSPSTLNRTIALLRRALDDPAEIPRFVETVHGAGYRYIGPIEVVTGRTRPIAAMFAPPPSVRPPARVTTLIGRESLLAQLAELLQQTRTLTILGAGGMGKTQSALEYARRHRDDYADGIWFFDLAHVGSAEQWLRSLAVALTLTPLPDIDLTESICGQLDGRQALLLLDNCDRIAAGLGSAVFRLLQGTDRLQVLATSQAPLNFLGESQLRIAPLSLPPENLARSQRALADVAASAAVQLLIERVRLVRQDFALTARNAAELAGICRRLDGMPLAIELAAPRLATLSADEVLERLDHRFSFLVSHVAGRDARHSNLTSLLDWSFSLLVPQEQRLLMWLSVFVGGWAMESVIDLASCMDLPPESAVEHFYALVDRSLVTVNVSTSPPRYRLLESVREFALERLAGEGQGGLARDAHLECMRRLSLRVHADMLGGRMRQRIEHLIHEEGNIDAAIDHGSGTRVGVAAIQEMLGALAVYHKARTHMAVGDERCERVLRAAAALGVPASSRLLLLRAIARFYLLQTDEAPHLEALQACNAASDAWGTSVASAFYAQWLANMGRTAEASVRARSAQADASRLDDAWLRSIAGVALAFVHLYSHHDAEAVEVLEPLQSASDDLHQRHFVHAYLGLGHFRLANHARAALHWLQCLQLANSVRSIRGAAGSIEGCAYLAAHLGDHSLAARCLGMAQHLRVRTSMALFPYWLSHHAQTLSALNAALGRPHTSALFNEAAAADEATFIEEISQHLERYATANTPAGS